MFDCSVIIPVYNRIGLIERAIDSVACQTVPVREIIVVDDGSTDGVFDHLKTSYPDIRLLRQTRAGVSAARNTGIAASQGRWVAFLDSDDEWLPEKIERQANWLSAHPRIKICHSDEIWIRHQVRVNQKKRHQKRGGWIYQHCLPLCVISPSAVVIERELFQLVGTFDQTLPVCEDYDLWLRITRQFEVGYIDEPLLLKYGGHADQLSKEYEAMDRYRIKVLARLLEENVLTSEQRKYTLETAIDKLNIYLKGARKRNKTSEVKEHEVLLMKYIAQYLGEYL